ncbi:MAG: hypothetical protein RL757_3137 [Bacteroidota bacterium]|jgi:allophanate hydrolase subunit 1
MKNVKIALAILAASFAATSAQAQMMITESFKVNLECNAAPCKKQLIDALYTKGVKNADWDVETRTLTVTYDPNKIAINDIRHRVDSVVQESAAADNNNGKKVQR